MDDAAGQLTVFPRSLDDLSDSAALRDAVREFIGSRVPDGASADDLTQDVLIKVHQRLPQVRDPRRLMGWVIQIARNAVTDHFRRAKPTEQLDENRIATPPARDASIQQEEAELREDLAQYVGSVAQGLPAIYREALVLTHFDGLTQVELAKRLGLSVSAAKSRVQRARAMVRTHVDRCCAVEVDAYGAVLECTPRQRSCDCSVR